MLRVTLLVSIAAVVSATKTAIVQTTSGPVRGEEITFEGTTYNSFKGIPYAAPPVGNLRFKAPQPPQKWTEVRDSDSYSKPCQQPKLNHLSCDDCLALNVFTPSLNKNDLKAVIVFIHGGGFLFGSGDDRFYGPEYLVQKNIVLVTLNYRLGPQGFLATNSPYATGNWGLKDQVAALKWVQANIERFGGDPQQVTLYGESAGAAAVHLHLFSPLSKGLFHKAIISSGSAVNRWACKHSDTADRYSRDLARLLGASEDEITDPQKRIRFLRAANSSEVTKRCVEVGDFEDPSYKWLKTRIFTPVIEAPGTQGAFLTEDPKDLLAKGKFAKVPLMMGLNDLEGSVAQILGLSEGFTPEVRKQLGEKVCEMLPRPLANAVIAENECAIVAKQIRDVYFDGKGFDSSLLNFLNLWGDIVMTKDIYNAQRTHTKFASKSSPLFNYYFTFDGKWNLMKRNSISTLPGAAHAEDLIYVFLPRSLKLPVLPESAPEVTTKNTMIDFISNFAKYGDPTPVVSDAMPVKWAPSTENQFSTMVIGKELTLKKEFLKRRMELWDLLSEKYVTKGKLESKKYKSSAL